MKTKNIHIKQLVIEIYEDFKTKYGRAPYSPEIYQILNDTFGKRVAERQIRRYVAEQYPNAYRNTQLTTKLERENKQLQLDQLKRDLSDLIHKEYDMIATDVQVRCAFPSKWIIVDDEHIPFMDVEMLQKIIELDGDADGIAMSEMIDRQEFSRFSKRSYISPVKVDQTCGDFMDKLESHFKYGVLLTGNNHLMRLLKWIQQLPDPEQVEILTYLTEGGLPKFTEKIKHFQMIRSFVCQIGKAVFCHPEDYLGDPLKTALRVVAWLRNQGDLVGINDFDSVMIGHTHKLSLDFASNRLLIADIGCVCHQQPYTLTGKLGYGAKNRWTLGYGKLYLDKDGNTDYYKSGVQFLGYTTIPQGVRNEDTVD